MTKFASVGLNPMVYRQTPESRFSHFESESGQAADAFPELLRLIAGHLATEPDTVEVIDEDGLVVKVHLPESLVVGRFFSGVVKLEEGDTLRSFFAPRVRAIEGEQPFIQTLVVGGKKSPAKRVEVIIYHRDALELDERTWIPPGADATVEVTEDWQVVSVNARDTVEPEPPTPQAMARNMAAGLGLPEGIGGTERTYTAEDFMRAILYWSARAMADDRK